jgi:hypothetical protein
MRRLPGAFSDAQDVGDVTTLVNSGIVEEIKTMVEK